MEESFVSKVVHAVIFIAVCTVLLSVGWNEPLRYRFLTSQEIAEIEGPLATPVPVVPLWFASRLKGTRLDEAPRYKSGDGGSFYSLPHRKADGLEPPPDRRTTER